MHHPFLSLTLQFLVDTLQLCKVPASRSKEDNEETSMPIQQFQHPTVGHQAVSRFDLFGSDILCGQVQCCAFVCRSIETCNTAKGDPHLTLVVGILVAAVNLPSYLAPIPANRRIGSQLSLGNRHKKLNLHHHPPLCKEHGIKWRLPGIIVV